VRVSENPSFEELLASVQTLRARDASDDEVAGWLKPRTVDFGESLSVFAAAYALDKRVAMDRLKATATWQRATTRFLILEPSGTARGEFHSINGRTYSVGDVLKLPGGACRVLAVDSADDPRFTAQLHVAPVE
jgi:hypothetical protein